MMQKTIKKGKREGSGKRLSYVVTEAGLVENDDTLDTSAGQKRQLSVRTSKPRALLGSITEVDDAKNKFKQLANRRKSNPKVSEEEEVKRKLSLLPKQKDPKAALAEINAAEAGRRRSSITIADIAETKKRFSAPIKLKAKRVTADKMARGGQFSQQESIEHDETGVGLIEAEAIKHRMMELGAALMMTRAVTSMSGPRRARTELINTVL